jgi:hypothetical protein
MTTRTPGNTGRTTRTDGNAISGYNGAMRGATKATEDAEARYVAVKGRAGKKVLHNGDPLALALDGLTPEAAMEACEAMLIRAGVATPEVGLVEYYGHLNPGMGRMNSANRVRGAMKKGLITPESLAEVAEMATEATAVVTEEPAAEEAAVA